MVPFEIRLEEVRPGFDRVAVEVNGYTLESPVHFIRLVGWIETGFLTQAS